MVCGEIGLAPSEFYQLLYSELVLLLDGWHARRRTQLRERREESAWVVSWLLLPHKNKDARDEIFSPDWLMRHTLNVAKGRKPARKFADHKESASAFFAALEAKSKKKHEVSDGQ